MFRRGAKSSKTAQDELSEHVAHTIHTVASLRSRAQKGVSRHQRAVELSTAALGRPRTLYAILLVVVAWMSFNLALPHPIDPPPFFWLQGAVGLAAMLTSTLILITQNRQTQEAEQRSQLDLQINLVAEQKITKVIELLEELRRDLPTVRDRVDPKAEAMTQSVDATAVLAALEETIEQRSDSPAASSGPSRR
ncbi:MAG: hypothetical protein JWM82_4310 [Myxococcales bacterium]|nr:hypothetical protein [Myxococcales bacterium]